MADCKNSDGAKHNNFETHSLKLNKVTIEHTGLTPWFLQGKQRIQEEFHQNKSSLVQFSSVCIQYNDEYESYCDPQLSS